MWGFTFTLGCSRMMMAPAPAHRQAQPDRAKRLLIGAPMWNDEEAPSRGGVQSRLCSAMPRFAPSTAEFEDLLEDTSDLVLDLDDAGRIVFANPAACRTTGLASLEMVGRPVVELVAPECRQIVERALRAVEGVAPVGELRLIGQGGRAIWLRFTLRKLAPQASCAWRLLGRDLTAIVAAEQRVRQLEEHFRAAFQTTPDAVAINRLSDGAYVEINEGFSAILGHSRADVIGRTSLDLGIWADPQERAALVQALKERGAVQGFEARFRKKNGLVELGVMSARVVTLNGEPHILSVTRDLTAWKLAERTLLDREASLEEAQQISRTLMAAIEQAAEDIIIVDPDGCIQYCNPSFQRITGYSLAEVIGRNPRILKSGHHDEAFYRTLWTTIKAGRTWTGRITNRRRDGALIVEDATISPITDRAGRPQGFVSVKRDVTAQLELEQAFYHAQKMESIGRLAGGVAHDFNNLLTVINGYSSLILGRLHEADPLRAGVGEILKAGERATSLTSQLLAFSRKQVTEPRVLDLSLAVHEAERMLRRILGEDIELQTRAAPGATVMADPGQVHQVLMNFAVNARDAMPKGGELEIETRVVDLGGGSGAGPADLDRGRYVVLTVRDSGVGMEPQVLEHIFEPFFTTKEPGKGTGLGLSTVYGIVRQNGGTITAESTPGEGTTMRVFLRQVEAGALMAPSGGEPVEVRGTETVLIVEDQEDVRRMTVQALRGYGYKVLEAEDGAAALDLAGRHRGPIDLVVTDVVMPVMGGVEMAERLQALRPGARVLFTSGYWGEMISHPGGLTPGTNYLPKPYTPEALAARIRAAVSQARSSDNSAGGLEESPPPIFRRRLTPEATAWSPGGAW